MKSVVAILLCVASAASAQLFLEAASGDEPPHLVPVDPRGDSYAERIAKHLSVATGECGQMLELPSFSPESWVGVHAEVSRELAEKHGGHWMVPDKEKKFTLTLLEASENLYYTMAENNDEKKTKDVRVKRTDRAISLELAVALQRAWAAAILQTRYASKSSVGTDGTTFEFGVWVRGLGYLRGKTWSPETGAPKELVEIGTDLRKLASNPNMGEADVIARLRKLETSCTGDEKK